MFNKLVVNRWEYTIYAEDKKGNSLAIKNIGWFDTPNKASAYISENNGPWHFFSNFETCEPGKTAWESVLGMWHKRPNKRGN